MTVLRSLLTVVACAVLLAQGIGAAQLPDIVTFACFVVMFSSGVTWLVYGLRREESA